MRIVVDTNVIASAIVFGGKPKQVVDLVVGGTKYKCERVQRS